MNVENVLMSAVGGLTTAVIFLFFWFKTHYDSLAKRLAECEEDRERLWERIAQLGTERG